MMMATARAYSWIPCHECRTSALLILQRPGRGGGPAGTHAIINEAFTEEICNHVFQGSQILIYFDSS